MIKNKGIIKTLSSQHGIKLGSSQQLNKTLEALGLIVKNGNSWLQTEKGMKFTPYKTRTMPANAWMESIIPFLVKSMRKK